MDLSNKPKKARLLVKKNLSFINFPFINKKKSFFHDLKNIYSLISIFKKSKPDLVHNFTQTKITRYRSRSIIIRYDIHLFELKKNERLNKAIKIKKKNNY